MTAPATLPIQTACRRTRRGLPNPQPRRTENTGSAPALVALTDLDGLAAAGIRYPSTVDGWRWLYRCRHERGLDRAFRRLGRRIVVDVAAYLAALRDRPSAP